MEKSDLYWQRRISDIERHVERLEAELAAFRQNPQNVGDYYTVDQMAKALNVCPLTIRRRISAGVINAVKVGKTWRIPKDELKEIFD